MVTFQLYWWMKTSGALFQARAGTKSEPLTFRKLSGKLPHMKNPESKIHDECTCFTLMYIEIVKYSFPSEITFNRMEINLFFNPLLI